MKYTIKFTKEFQKEFKKLDKYVQQMIKAWIEKNLVNCEDPRIHGKALTANLKNKWRYRIGNFRMICEIKDNELIIYALRIAHRREVYD